MGSAKPKNILLLLGTAFEDAEAAIALDACRWSQYRNNLTPLNVTVTGLHDVVQGNFGTSIRIDKPLSCIDPADYDAVVIPGGFRGNGFDEIYCQPVYDLLRALRENNAQFATMCVGVLPVARAGLMQGGQATTYEFSRHSNYDILQECGCIGVHEPVVEWQNIISCSGPAYSEHVMEMLLAKLLGEEAKELAQYRCGISA